MHGNSGYSRISTLINHATSALMRNSIDEAYNAILSARALKIPTQNLEYIHALCLLKQKRYETARTALEEELHSFPHNKEAYELLQAVLLELSSIQEKTPGQSSLRPWEQAPSSIKKILFLRNDAIGDSVLASSMLPHLVQKFPAAQITVACRDNVRELYEACPYVSNIISYEVPRVIEDGEYLLSIIKRLEDVKADLALNSAYSREGLGDHLIKVSNAKYRIAHLGDLENDTPELRQKHNETYTTLVPSSGRGRPELERHRDFLAALGIQVQSLEPMVWTKPSDEAFADEFMRKNLLSKSNTIALASTAQWDIKVYDKFEAVLKPLLKEYNFSIVALGAAKESNAIQSTLNQLGGSHFNLAGKTTLPQTAALLKRIRMLVGIDTSTAHIASAVGTPNVIVLGGGHFGRFLPYSPHTSVVCLPLSCYHCNWQCQFQKTHCIKDIAPETVAHAIQQTLQKISPVPRVFAQSKSRAGVDKCGPAWTAPQEFLESSFVEISEFDPNNSGYKIKTLQQILHENNLR